MLPRWLEITEEEIEEGEMLNRGRRGNHGDIWKAKASILAGIVLMLLLLTFAWGSGCNSDRAFMVKSDVLWLKMEPCGDGPFPSAWMVTADHLDRFIVPVERSEGEDGIWMKLGYHYHLHLGENLIEYRAVRNGYVSGPTESIRFVLGAAGTPPPLGGFTVAEIREITYTEGEGDQ